MLSSLPYDQEAIYSTSMADKHSSFGCCEEYLIESDMAEQ